MRSKQAEKYDAKSANGYSDLQVLESPAGYYIGTIFTADDGFREPGSRDSDYFKTREAAEAYLKSLEAGEELPLRDHP